MFRMINVFVVFLIIASSIQCDAHRSKEKDKGKHSRGAHGSKHSKKEVDMVWGQTEGDAKETVKLLNVYMKRVQDAEGFKGKKVPLVWPVLIDIALTRAEAQKLVDSLPKDANHKHMQKRHAIDMDLFPFVRWKLPIHFNIVEEHYSDYNDYTCRPGQDCPNNDIEHSSVEPDECKQKCNDDTSCVSYTTSPDGDCWLKSLCDVTKCRQNSQRTTCFKSGNSVVTSIREAFELWQSLTCVRFKEINTTDLIKFPQQKILQVRGDMPGCWSFVGDRNDLRIQTLNLQPPFCTGLSGVAVHEILHAIGLYHLEDLPERNDSLLFLHENIIPQFAFFFNPVSERDVNRYGIGTFDFGSILQFRVDALTINGKPTILPKNPDYRYTKGMVPERPSFLDITLVNRAYKCYDSSKFHKCKIRKSASSSELYSASAYASDSSESVDFGNSSTSKKSSSHSSDSKGSKHSKGSSHSSESNEMTFCEKDSKKCCFNGYPNPGITSKCSTCLCPDGLSGDKCDEPVKGTNNCNPTSTVIDVTETTQCVTSPEYYSKNYTNGVECGWILKAKKKSNFIQMWFDLTNGFGVYHFNDSGGICHHYVEIKLNGNFTLAGKRVCGSKYVDLNQRDVIHTFTNEAIIYFNGLSEQFRDNIPDDLKRRGFKLCFRTTTTKGTPCKVISRDTGKCIG